MTTPLRLPSWERHYCPRCRTVLNCRTRRVPNGNQVDDVVEWRCTVCNQSFSEAETRRRPAPAHEIGPVG